MKYNIIAGLDVGNGYLKGRVQVNDHKSISVDMPSSVSYISASEPILAAQPDDAYMSDIVNLLDLEITSPAIRTRDSGRIFCGVRGVRSGGSQVEFNISDHTPKCEEPLSTQLILASLSGALLSDIWKAEGKLPDEGVEAHVILTTALPISDYYDYRHIYSNSLMQGKHVVNVRNFKDVITITFVFDHVEVMAEGASAQFAITDLAEKTSGKFLDIALDIARENGFDIDPEYTGQTLMGASNTIGVDVGEGTVNFPVFENRNVAVEKSSSINKGYGTVLEKVNKMCRSKDLAFDSRKALADFMVQEKDSQFLSKRKIYKRLKKYIDDETVEFVRDLIYEYKNVFKAVGQYTDVIYVYGGGSGPIRDFLYPELIEASTIEDDGESIPIPVIYMDAEYSRNLNRNGLFQMSKYIAENSD